MESKPSAVTGWFDITALASWQRMKDLLPIKFTSGAAVKLSNKSMLNMPAAPGASGSNKWMLPFLTATQSS